jgi:ABC-type transport system substrate-binding protein
VWPWQLSFAEGSPWLDKRVRHAANLCVDREGLKKLLGGMMAVPKGTVPPGHPWWGNPKFDIRYDEGRAGADGRGRPQRRQAAEGEGADQRLGSGQMQPLPMNEFVQQSLKQCHFDVQFDVIEWNTLFTNWRKGAKDPSANGANAINVSFAAMDPFFAMVRFTSTKTFPPVSNNWGYFGNAEFDKLVADARTSFDDKAARRRAGQAACAHRRGGAVRLDRPRRRPARDERQGQGRGAAEELVHRHRDDDDGVTAATALRRCPLTRRPGEPSKCNERGCGSTLDSLPETLSRRLRT